MIAVMLIFGDPSDALAMPASGIVLLLISSLVGIAAAHVLYYIAISRLGVALVSGTTLLSPFLTAAASQFIYNERLLPQQWLGGIVLVLGAGLLVWAQQHVVGSEETGASLQKAESTHDSPAGSHAARGDASGEDKT
jgi:drug/metabolite transporter (DMT)-like permease